jgi:hypothetical protein
VLLLQLETVAPEKDLENTPQHITGFITTTGLGMAAYTAAARPDMAGFPGDQPPFP